MYSCICVHVLVCRHLWALEVDICDILNCSSSHFFFFRQDLIIELVKSGRTSCLCLPVWGLQMHVATSDLYTVAQYLNSCPHAHVADSLPFELSHWLSGECPNLLPWG